MIVDWKPVETAPFNISIFLLFVDGEDKWYDIGIKRDCHALNGHTHWETIDGLDFDYGQSDKFITHWDYLPDQ